MINPAYTRAGDETQPLADEWSASTLAGSPEEHGAEKAIRDRMTSMPATKDMDFMKPTITFNQRAQTVMVTGGPVPQLPEDYQTVSEVSISADRRRGCHCLLSEVTPMVPAMSVPDVIPIRHEPDYRTSTIGRWQGGQFFASVTAAFPEGWSGDDWQPQKRWCAVLHRFDGAGRHLDSRIQFTGTTADGEQKAIDAARLLLDEWLDALPERQYQDIAIAPFAVRLEGSLFGLVVEDDVDEEDDEVWAEFYPDGLGFNAPWNGCYDT